MSNGVFNFNFLPLVFSGRVWTVGVRNVLTVIRGFKLSQSAKVTIKRLAHIFGIAK